MEMALTDADPRPATTRTRSGYLVRKDAFPGGEIRDRWVVLG
jgi:hypothetical protein